MTHWELTDVELVLMMSRQRGHGHVALWSLAAMLLVPGLLDDSFVLIALGVVLTAIAIVVSVRALLRPDRPARSTPRPDRRPPTYAPQAEAPSRAGPGRTCRSRPRSRRRPFMHPGDRAPR